MFSTNSILVIVRHLDYLINLHTANFKSLINSPSHSHTTRNRASKGRQHDKNGPDIYFYDN